MKRALIAILLCPTIALGQTVEQDLMMAHGINPLSQKTREPQVIQVQPGIPIPQDRGPWGTGYSRVTTTRETRQLFDRDLTGVETVERVVPNDALGQPLRGAAPWNW
jgi:hypothetical protein